MGKSRLCGGETAVSAEVQTSGNGGEKALNGEMANIRRPVLRSGRCIVKFDFGKMKQDLGKDSWEKCCKGGSRRFQEGFSTYVKLGAGRTFFQILLHLGAPTQKVSKLKSGRQVRPKAFKFPQFPASNPSLKHRRKDIDAALRCAKRDGRFGPAEICTFQILPALCGFFAKYCAMFFYRRPFRPWQGRGRGLACRLAVGAHA